MQQRASLATVVAVSHLAGVFGGVFQRSPPARALRTSGDQIARQVAAASKRARRGIMRLAARHVATNGGTLPTLADTRAAVDEFFTESSQ
jgi:hypothetical protein